MRKINLFVVIVLIAWLLQACGAPAETPVASNPTQTPVVLPSPLPTHTPSPTLTNTPAPTPTATPLPEIPFTFLTLNSVAEDLVISDMLKGGEETLAKGMRNLEGYSISPNAHWMLFFARFEQKAYAINLATRQIYPFPYEYSSAVWHPSGEALLAYEKGYSKLAFVRLADMSVLSRVDRGWTPVFSPDGSKVAFIIEKDVVLLDVLKDTSGQVAGLSDQVTSLGLISRDQYYSQLKWSPDGRWLAMLTQTLGTINRLIITINLDGSDVRQRVDSTAVLQGFRVEMEDFVISPDGSHIAFAAMPIYPELRIYTRPQVYLINLGTDQLTRLSGGEDDEVGDRPIWHPDGKQLVYQTGIIFQNTDGSPSYQINGMMISSLDGSQKRAIERQDLTWYYIRTLLPGEPQVFKSAFAEPLEFTCSTGWSRISAGGQAVVAPGQSNRVRSEPKKGDNVVGNLLAGSIMTVLDGPVCADGLVFWQVQSDKIPDGKGWTAEGDIKEHWLQPLP